jgi:hypothetical protein
MLQTFDLVDLLKHFTVSLILLKTMVILVLDIGPTNITQQQMQYILS